MKFHVFLTDNLSEEIVIDHKMCCEKVGIQVIYHKFPTPNDFNLIYIAHGEFMTQILKDEKDDVVCFLDVDCLPYNYKLLDHLYKWVKARKSFCGNAQSHVSRRNHIYAAASMLMVSKDAWYELDQPDLSPVGESENTKLVDTAQNLSLIADKQNWGYRLLYPFGYDDPGQRWELGPYGYFGRGTLYPGTWHYFRISDFKEKLPELWKKRVSNIVNGEDINPIYPSLPYDLVSYKFSLKAFFLSLKKRKRL